MAQLDSHARPSWFGIRFSDEADSTVVGVPLGLINYTEAEPETFGRADEPDQAAVIEDNLIEGNRIVGAEGLGIEVTYASRNRIVNNTITGIGAREPFLGNVLSEPVLPSWGVRDGGPVDEEGRRPVITTPHRTPRLIDRDENPRRYATPRTAPRCS